MIHLTTTEILQMRDMAECYLLTPTDGNILRRIRAANTIRAVNRELDRREPVIAFDFEGHGRFMRAVINDDTIPNQR